MLKDSDIGNIAAIGPAGHPPCSKYERLIADAKQVRAPTTIVVHPCEETALRGPIESGGSRHHRTELRTPSQSERRGRVVLRNSTAPHWSRRNPSLDS
jgi:hypothetical protein